MHTFPKNYGMLFPILYLETLVFVRWCYKLECSPLNNNKIDYAKLWEDMQSLRLESVVEASKHANVNLLSAKVKLNYMNESLNWDM